MGQNHIGMFPVDCTYVQYCFRGQKIRTLGSGHHSMHSHYEVRHEKNIKETHD